MREVFSSLVHCLNDYVKGNLSASKEEVRKGERINSSHCRNCVSFNTGYLNETANGVAGKSEMMLHCDLCGVFDLINTHFK